MTTPAARQGVSPLLIPFAAGALIAVSLGIYGKTHDPTGIAVGVAGFSSAGAMKAWLTTAAAVLALVQLGSALVMYGKARIAAPSWIGGLHCWSGRSAFLATIPVAFHCLYAFGFQAGDTRVLVHSLLGCFFYGLFTAKMLSLRARNLPGWALPVLGGAAFTVLIGLWLSASLWFFTTIGVTL